MTAPTSPGVVPADVLVAAREALAAQFECSVQAFPYHPRRIRGGLLDHTYEIKAIARAIMADRANRPSLTEDKWKPIDKAPSDTDILIGAWFEDDSNGYFGGSRWKWVASGRIESERVWIDVNDEFHGQIAELAGFDKPTHFKLLRALADRSEPRQEKEGSQ